VILFVGALDRAHHFKGVPDLLQAFARVISPNTLLLIAGEGDLKERDQELAHELNLAGSTRFVGAIPHEQLPPFYAAADLVVLPSNPPESFGMVLIEAMACGRPVLAYDIPGVRSVVSDGQDGLLAKRGDVEDLAEKIDRLLDDPALCREMGRRGRARVEADYTWEQAGVRLERIYLEILAARDEQ
jgi:glycosyltransferase involved in cell wall biosynthesis